MNRRIDHASAAPGGADAFEALDRYVADCGLDHLLVELVKMRVSQINGCAFCLAMHGRIARRLGARPVQLDTLAAWRESPVFDERTKAALLWAERVTEIGLGVPDEDTGLVRRHYSDRELVDLTWAIILINGWNRAMIAFHVEPETGGA
jgi:AhpD family alkylhydroperoxidase